MNSCRGRIRSGAAASFRTVLRYVAFVCVCLLVLASARRLIPGICANSVPPQVVSSISTCEESLAPLRSCCEAMPRPTTEQSGKPGRTKGRHLPNGFAPCAFCILAIVPNETLQVVTLQVPVLRACSTIGLPVEHIFDSKPLDASRLRAPPTYLVVS